jgi:hypothetical protein
MKRKLLGTNRTGCAVAADRTAEMIAATKEFRPTSTGSLELLGEVRATYTESGEAIGTMPPPASATGLAKTVMKAVTGGAPLLLMDKLGERLAFERAGTRLWEAMIAKFDATGGFRGGPTRDQVAHVRDEELRHFHMLRELMERLDGDPTAVTPSAEVQAVASMGLPAVLTDPRTDFVQCLEAALVAELVDNDCWPALIELLTQGGYEEEAQSFLCAVESEREHLQCVRMWVAAAEGRSVDAARELSDAETSTVMASPAIATLRGGDGGARPDRPSRVRRARPQPQGKHLRASRGRGRSNGKVKPRGNGRKRRKTASR